MNKKIALWAPLLALLVFAGTASAAGLSDDSLNKLLDLSGIDKQIGAFPDLLKLGVDRAQAAAKAQAAQGGQQAPLSDQDFSDLKTAMVDAFQPGPLLQSTGGAIRKKVTEPEATKLIAWFESDLGKKITQAEVDASTPAAQQDMINQAQTLLGDKDRMAFAQKLDKLLHATDERIKFQERNATAMLTAVSAKQNPGQQVSADDVKKLKQKIATALEHSRPNLEMATAVSFAYTYRNIDMESLNKYSAFLSSPAARHFYDSSRAGMANGLDQAVARMMDNISAIAKKKKAG